MSVLSKRSIVRIFAVSLMASFFLPVTAAQANTNAAQYDDTALVEAATAQQADLSSRFSDSFAGLWIADGHMHIAFTDSATAQSQRQHSNNTVVAATHSLKELRAVQNVMDNQIDLPNTRITRIYIDIPANVVRVALLPGTPAAERRRLQELVTDRSTIAFETKDFAHIARCASIHCDDPLRGGNRIAMSRGFCSGGFTARSRQDNKLYLITAGHCLRGQNAKGDVKAYMIKDRSWHVIGKRHNSIFGKTGDIGIIGIDDTADWKPRHWVRVFPSQGNPATVRDDEHSITSAADAVVGSYVCKTGASTRTTCGKVTATGVTANYGGLIVKDFTTVSLKACQGDSGSPVFKNHTAYGIVSGIDATWRDPHGRLCGGKTYFQNIVDGSRRMNMTVVQ